MRRAPGVAVSLCALFLLALTSTLRAETYTASVILSPGSEVSPSPAPPAGATGSAVVTINITRDAAGAITAATMNFRGTFSFPSSVSVVGFHIHEGSSTVNGPIRFDLGINSGSAIFFASGSGFIDLNVPTVNLAVLPTLLANPAGFYVNLHTTVNPGGAMRGQITQLIETQANTVAMTTAQEVSPTVPLPPNASGVGTFTANPVRNPATGVITGGTVRFTVAADLPPNSTVVGLHIHRGAAGTNGPVVIDGRLSATNSITLPTGKGMISVSAPITNDTALTALKDLLVNPTGFYMNLHTTVNTGGVIRGQLTAVSQAPIIQQSDTAFLPGGGTLDATVSLWVSGIDSSSAILVNGQEVTSFLDAVTAKFMVTIPGSLRTNPGILWVQAKNQAGLLSAPFAIVVGAPDKLNTDAIATVDAAKFGNVVAPDSIVAGFSTKLATQEGSATAQPLPTTINGTTIYVNGVAAGLLYVSAGQINYVIPTSTLANGPAQVVVVAGDGTITRGQVGVQSSIPALFTRRADGTGAPAAVASADGQTFNLPVSEANGTPIALDAGNFIALFGTGFRHGSTANTNAVTIGGTNITPLFVGPQGQFEALDQVNIQIPQSLAGRGDVDLTITIDGKSTNVVKLRIK